MTRARSVSRSETTLVCEGRTNSRSAMSSLALLSGLLPGRCTALSRAGSGPNSHAHIVALYALWYNFVLIHKTLRVTPATAAGIADWLWLTVTAARAI